MENIKENWIERRNRLLVDFFKKSKLDFEVKFFDVNKPVVILDSYVMSCYVHNFELRFVDKARGGDVLFVLKLNKFSNPNDIKKPFEDWVYTCEHKKVYKIQFGDSNLYLSGYNFTDRINSEGKYPVFAPKNYKIYFDKEYAEEICSQFNGMFSNALKVI